VRPPLDPLERMLAHSYQLLAQLTAVKTMLLQRRGRLNVGQIQAPLQQAAEAIDGALAAPSAPAPQAPEDDSSSGPVALPDAFDQDLSPWLLRRLHLAAGIARHLGGDAQDIRQALGR
jgi:hypothetical protein